MQKEFLARYVTRCVECGASSMTPEGAGLRCHNCGYVYPFDENGVLVALATRSGRHLPDFYRSAFYERWIRAWEDMVKRGWVIYERPLYRAFSLSGHRKVRSLMGRLHVAPPFVVDLGCGEGRLKDVLGDVEYVGIDLNASFLARLKRRHPNALAIQADLTNLPVATGVVDCCVSAHVLEHLYLLAESFEEVRRILTPGGAFIFSIPTEGGLGWSLGRRIVTGPRLRRDYDLDVEQVMAIEHINDARRVLRIARLYFRLSSQAFAPFPFLPVAAVNNSITVRAERLPDSHELVRRANDPPGFC